MSAAPEACRYTEAEATQMVIEAFNLGRRIERRWQERDRQAAEEFPTEHEHEGLAQVIPLPLNNARRNP